MPRKFKEARQINKLKVIEAAAKLGISQPTLSAWEGERKFPGLDSLENMADLYGVTTDYLLDRSELCPSTERSCVWQAWVSANRASPTVAVSPRKRMPDFDYIQQDEPKCRATMHINRKPGEQIEVDWAGDPAELRRSLLH